MPHKFPFRGHPSGAYIHIVAELSVAPLLRYPYSVATPTTSNTPLRSSKMTEPFPSEDSPSTPVGSDSLPSTASGLFSTPSPLSSLTPSPASACERLPPLESEPQSSSPPPRESSPILETPSAAPRSPSITDLNEWYRNFRAQRTPKPNAQYPVKRLKIIYGPMHRHGVGKMHIPAHAVGCSSAATQEESGTGTSLAH